MGLRLSKDIADQDREEIQRIEAKAMILGKFNGSTFIEKVFESARTFLLENVNAAAKSTAWTGVPPSPIPSPSRTAAIELALREHQSSIHAETAGMALMYACCTHITLVPILLELFKDTLPPDWITKAIQACGTRHPDTCWLIMFECMSRLSSDCVAKCFNICCKKNNTAMLTTLVQHHKEEIESFVWRCGASYIEIDQGLRLCASHGDNLIIKLLVREFKITLGPRLLLSAVRHSNLEAARLIFETCKEWLPNRSRTINPNLVRECKYIDKAFKKAAENGDTPMLQLFIDEYETELDSDTIELVFLISLYRNNQQVARLLFERCVSKIKFEYGDECELNKIHDEDMWALLVEAFGERAKRNG